MAQAKKRKENGEGVSGTLTVPHTDTGSETERISQDFSGSLNPEAGNAQQVSKETQDKKGPAPEGSQCLETFEVYSWMPGMAYANPHSKGSPSPAPR